MKSKMLSLLVFSGLMIVAYFKLTPHKKLCCKNKEQSTLATLISKEKKVESYNTGLSSGLGCIRVAKFKTGDGRELELFAPESALNEIKEGTKGKLTFKEDRFVAFREIVEEKKEDAEICEAKMKAEETEEATGIAENLENKEEVEPITMEELAE